MVGRCRYPDQYARVTVSRVLLAVVLVSVVGCSGPADYIAEGTRLAAAGKQREAVIAFQNALKADDTSGEALYRLGDAYAALNDHESALHAYVRAADRLPTAVDPQLKAARYLMLTGQFVDARRRAEKALALDPRNIDAEILIG